MEQILLVAFMVCNNHCLASLLEERFDIINDITNQTVITEVEYKKIVDHFKLEITDVEKFVKVNDLQPWYTTVSIRE